eukprot:826785-Pyramimonas_sp.AAC.1
MRVIRWCRLPRKHRGLPPQSPVANIATSARKPRHLGDPWNREPDEGQPSLQASDGSDRYRVLQRNMECTATRADGDTLARQRARNVSR